MSQVLAEMDAGHQGGPWEVRTEEGGGQVVMEDFCKVLCAGDRGWRAPRQRQGASWKR